MASRSTSVSKRHLFWVTTLLCIQLAIQVPVLLAGTAENTALALSAAGVSPGLTPSSASPRRPSSVPKREKDKHLKSIEIEAGYAYRQGRFDWNIAGDLQGNNPDVLSELTWKDLLIHEFFLDMRASLRNAFYLKGFIHFGMIVDGKNRDSDFAADSREMEFSRSNNDADQGNTLDGLFGAGYRLRCFSESLSLIPLAGYSYHRQHLTMTDGYQTITWSNGPSLGPFGGLDSTYDAEWRGPWIGLDLILETEKFAKALKPVSFHAGWAYHWASYHAEADWNLRDDFMHPKSFEHDADGLGMVFSLGIRIDMNDWSSLRLGYENEAWSTEAGIDRVFLASGAIVKTRLNEVNWNSEVYRLGFLFRF